MRSTASHAETCWGWRWRSAAWRCRVASGASGPKRIESLAPELDKIIAASEPIQELAEGFGGPLGPAEGPVWWQGGG